MTETQFHQTRMGQRFYESTMPALVEQLARTNELLARFIEQLARSDPRSNVK